MNYADEVFELIQRTYATIGGNVNIGKPEDLCQDAGMWKLWRQDGKIVVACIYKDKLGRKSVAIGHDGSRKAKVRLLRMFAEDIKFKRCWAEISGPAGVFYLKAGVPVIPNKYAAQLLGKEILAVQGDFVYMRNINGKPYAKVLVGFPQGLNIEETITPDITEIIKHITIETID